MKKRILSIFLTLLMVLSIAPLGIFTFTGAAATTASDFEYYVYDSGEAYISDYNGSETELEIPSEINGHTVTCIGGGAFRFCSNLTSVTIPDTVTLIDWHAFEYCSNLTSVTIPDSVTWIGGEAFYRCYNLANITLGNGIKEIGQFAFHYTAYYEKSSNWESKGLYINNYLVDVKNNVSSFDVKSGTKVIANRAFNDCTSLTTVTIPNSVTSIGYRTFYCCSGLTSITIPNSVTSIGDQTFYCCSGLTSITIPNSVTSIGYRTFYCCSGLTSITIPNSVTSINDSAFYACHKLSDIYYQGKVHEWSRIGYDNNVIIHCTNGTVNDYLYDVKDDETAVIKRYRGFAETVTVPATIGGYKVTEIGDEAFENKSNYNWETGKYGGVTNVVVSEGITHIGSYAFQECRALKSISLPSTLKSIGYNAFSLCVNLLNVKIPSGVKAIGANAFSSCTRLESAELSKALTMIDYGTFAGCTNLRSVTIGKKVESIGYDAFHNVSHIYVVNYEGSEADWNKIQIHEQGNGVVKYAPKNYGYTIACTHQWDGGAITKKATCTTDGVKTFTCKICGSKKSQALAKTGHKPNAGVVTKKATYDATGVKTYKCTVCKKTVKTETIKKLAKTSLAKAKITVKDQTYSGKEKKPSVTVKLGSKTLKKGTDYTVSYKNNKKIGKATVTIKGIKKYSGSVSKTFKINPKKVKSLKLKSSKKKQLTVSWKKDSKVTGYQIVYATNSKFTKGKKTVTVKSYKTYKKTIKSLKSKKTYYVKVRSYKTVSGKKYYSAYTSYKKLKIK